MNFENIDLYLPKYLSSDSLKELYSGLKDFPDNIDTRLYTSGLDPNVIFQGDCLPNLPIVNLPDTSVKNATAVVLSNTCDIDQGNKRFFFKSQILYAPIINLKKYKEGLVSSGLDKDKVDAHIGSLKKQEITQIFYFPKFNDELEDPLLFFDRIYNVSNDFVDREVVNRIFSLSDYGIYLFLFKLSLHFTRIQDKVERGNKK